MQINKPPWHLSYTPSYNRSSKLLLIALISQEPFELTAFHPFLSYRRSFCIVLIVLSTIKLIEIGEKLQLGTNDSLQWSLLRNETKIAISDETIS